MVKGEYVSADVLQEDILQTLAHAHKPALSTEEIAQRLNTDTSTVSRTLEPAVEQGKIGTKMVGHVRVWWKKG